MRTTIAIATFLALGAGATGVSAVTLAGSDTLKDLTIDVINHVAPVCAGVAGTIYAGGGSTTGQTAMSAGTQKVAPMSRAINNGACTGATAIPVHNATLTGPAQDRAQNMNFALDGISVVAATSSLPLASGANPLCGSTAYSAPGNPAHVITATNLNGVAGLQCPGCTGAGLDQYTIAAGAGFASFADVLRVVYTGLHNNGTKDCNSDVRWSMVNNYGSLFEGACTSGACTTLKHAFRRSDLSGTTDTFLTLIGIGGLNQTTNTNPFCNGVGATVNPLAGTTADFLDNDPIRRACDPNEDVCGAGASPTLGLVLPLYYPETSGTVGATYPTTACTAGPVTAWVPTPFPISKCPDGGDTLVGLCLAPVIDLGGGNYNAACLSATGDKTFFDQALGGDGRHHNLLPRKNESFTVDSSTIATGSRGGVIAGDSFVGGVVGGAFYRIHSAHKVNAAAGSILCKETTETRTIGCLAQANPCTLGFAGREATDVPSVPVGTVSAANIANIAPTVPLIQNLVTGGTPVYPLARKLYFNTEYGWPNVAGPELALGKCFEDLTFMNPIIADHNFVPLPTQPGNLARCEDFNETTTCATGTTNVDACAVQALP